MYDLNYYTKNGKTIYEIYKNSHLPENGWLQACINCDTITSFRLELFNKNNIIYYTYYCKNCAYSINNNSCFKNIKNKCFKNLYKEYGVRL